MYRQNLQDNFNSSLLFILSAGNLRSLFTGFLKKNKTVLCICN